MPQITGQQIIEVLQELREDCQRAALLEETKYRDTDEYMPKFYTREANIAALCGILIKMARRRELENDSWEYAGLLGPRPGHFGVIYWAFDSFGEALTERGILIDEANFESMRSAFVYAEENDLIWKVNKKAVIEAHRIMRDFIRRCLE